tara:strand:- start:258 stop:536 length:279 start_codon:yes stop_codon:yes gene_type:complete
MNDPSIALLSKCEIYLILKYSNNLGVNNRYIDEICINELIEKTNLNPNVFKPISGNGSYGTMDVNTIAPIRSNSPKTFQANKTPHIIFDGLL